LSKLLLSTSNKRYKRSLTPIGWDGWEDKRTLEKVGAGKERLDSRLRGNDRIVGGRREVYRGYTLQSRGGFWVGRKDLREKEGKSYLAPNLS
jgi:hypothetical protein